MDGLTYAGSGVNYAGALDPFKLLCQKAAAETGINIRDFHGGRLCEFVPSRGESAYLIEDRKAFLAHVEEGLGTKNLVADAVCPLTGKSYYDGIAQDTVAMIVNDLLTLGALPLSVAMHIACGDSEWFNDETRNMDLAHGWRTACDMAQCAWGGGETPTLKGVIVPGKIALSGSAFGYIQPKSRLITGKKIRHGDEIVMIESSGIHANGLTLARQIAGSLPEGYNAKLPGGRTYGETLLDPTHIYVRFLRECFARGINIHYAVNITGHGWRKLMRAEQPFTYDINVLPDQLPIFDFIQKRGPVSWQEMYGNYNMGAGFAVYVPQGHVDKTIRAAEVEGLKAWHVGSVVKGEKKVVIKPMGLTFEADSLAVR